MTEQNCSKHKIPCWLKRRVLIEKTGHESKYLKFKNQISKYILEVPFEHGKELYGIDLLNKPRVTIENFQDLNIGYAPIRTRVEPISFKILELFEIKNTDSLIKWVDSMHDSTTGMNYSAKDFKKTIRITEIETGLNWVFLRTNPISSSFYNGQLYEMELQCNYFRLS